jgi:hypothetical protein
MTDVMTEEVMMGVRVPRGLRLAANATAELNGMTLAEWIAILLADNLHPATRPLFLTEGAQRIDRKHSSRKSHPA